MQDDEDQEEDYKTLCCEADWYVKGRSDFRCCECHRDVTIEVIVWAKWIDE